MKENQSVPEYPLSENSAQDLKTNRGTLLEDISMSALLDGQLSAEDLRIRDETLRAQAAIARKNGYLKLADNLSRASELTRVPNEEILRMYEALRPGRSTYAELVTLAEKLENQYQAYLTAKFVLEGAQVYQERDLLRKPENSLEDN